MEDQIRYSVPGPPAFPECTETRTGKPVPECSIGTGPVDGVFCGMSPADQSRPGASAQGHRDWKRPAL
eukprot:220539-Alexandrium_andersonii.AAC.1